MSQTSPRPSSQTDLVVIAWAALLVLMLGAVRWDARVLGHGLAIVPLLAVFRYSNERLERAGAARSALLTTGLTVALWVLYWIPLPHEALAVIAPDTASVKEGWGTLALDPLNTLRGLSTLLFAATGLFLGTLLGSRARLRKRLSQSALALLVATTVLGLAHVLLDTQSLFGLIGTSSPPGQAYLAPLVNPNHAGTWVAVLVPLALVDLKHLRATTTAVVACCAGAIVYLSGSVGAALALAAGLAVLLLRQLKPTVIASVMVACLGLAFPIVLSLSSFSGSSVVPRLEIWADSLTSLASNAPLGVGPGGFEYAFSAWRTDANGHVVEHAHSEPVQWLVEFGAPGVLFVLLVAWILRGGNSAHHQRTSRALTAAFTALVVHSLVDFPLRLPALLTVGALLVGARASVTRDPGGGQPRLAKAAAGALIVANMAALTLSLTQSVGGRYTADLLNLQQNEQRQGAQQATAILGPLAPPEAALSLAIDDRSQAAQHTTAAVHKAPGRPDIARLGSRLLLRSEDLEGALLLAQRAVARGPADWRNHANLASMSEGQQAIDAWAAAFATGAPMRLLSEAWKVMPVGVVWVDAMKEARPHRLAALGDALRKAGDHEAAVLAFDYAATQTPSYANHLGRIASLRATGRIDAASEAARGALDAGNTQPAMVRLAAELYESQGDLTAARDTWLLRAGTDQHARLRAASLTLRADGPKQTLELVNRWRLAGQGSDGLILLEAQSHQQLGDHQSCIRTLSRTSFSLQTRDRAEKLLVSCTQQLEPSP